MDYYCNECDEDITPREYGYSMANYHRPLCRECQRDEDELICWKCGEILLPQEYEDTEEEFGRALCRDCLPKKPESKPKKSVKPEDKHEPKSKKIVMSEAKSETQKAESTDSGIKKFYKENKFFIDGLIAIGTLLIIIKTLLS